MYKSILIILLATMSIYTYGQKKRIYKDSINSIKEIAISGTANKFASNKVSSSLRLKTEISKIPQNIQIVTNELLKNQNITTMMENVTRNISGAQMNEHFGNYANINMRGFKLPSFRNGMNIDIGYGPLATDLSMVENIEFVKGPSGFMTSAGAPSGIYNVVTKKPTKKPVNEVSFSGGSFNFYRASLDLGGALTENGKLQYRFNSMYQYSETNRQFENNSRYSIVPSFKYEFNDNTSITTEFTYQKAKQMLSASYVFTPAEKGLGSLDRDISHIDQNYPSSDIEEVNLFIDFNHNFNTKWSINSQYMIMQYKQLGYTNWVYAIHPLGYTQRMLNNFDTKALNELAQIYLNGEVTFLGITHKLLSGIDYKKLNSKYDWSHIATYDPIPFNLFQPSYGNAVYPKFDRNLELTNIGSGTEYTSVYAQDEIWLLNNKLRVTLAGRYFNGKTNDDYKNEITIKKIIPRAGISFDLTKNFTLYSQYDNSIIPNYGTNRTGKTFDPEYANNIEAGFKKSFLKDKLKTTISAYQITKKNVLVTDPYDINNKLQIGKVRSEGLEFDIQGQLSPQLNIVLNYAFTEVKTIEDTNPLNIGKRIEGHSKHTTNGWINYNFKEESIFKGFGTMLGYQYLVDRSTSNWGMDNKTILPDYLRVDTGINWRYRGLNIALNVNNLFNKYLYSGGIAGTIAYWQSEPGRNWRAMITYKF
ncbi:TonB-dependent siderophore receptor [Flavobacterium oreochromis]|uniref:TonB-dependent siderophore receptor n=1 Tax=Flavobacterium oreochromis TaxID=2906078 RepID=A0ABW8P555_9FLAO|nr:TonB-dependent siderophore receptor [Flavobacterium oreochromis]OWP76338.1 TonB-dependent siderophore receptor [Flavobacterium oreochromis]